MTISTTLSQAGRRFHIFRLGNDTRENIRIAGLNVSPRLPRWYYIAMRIIPPFSSRALFLAGLIALSAAQAPGQTKSGTGNVPFFPKGFGSPDEFFEQMFGKSTPDEEQLLESIEISPEEEREFGEPQVEEFLD